MKRSFLALAGTLSALILTAGLHAQSPESALQNAPRPMHGHRGTDRDVREFRRDQRALRYDLPSRLRVRPVRRARPTPWI